MYKGSLDRITVLVTGVGGGGHGHEVMKALGLAATPYRVVAADMNPESLGLYEADASYIVPAATHAGYVDAVIDVCRREGVEALVPGSEPELRAVSASRGRFASEGILALINDARVIDLCMDKWATMQFMAENGFNVPQSVLAESEDDCAKIVRMPVVVKPAVGGGGSNLAFIAQDQEEARFFVRYILRAGGLPIVQEYVGSPDDEYTVGVLSTLDGEFVGSIAVHRKIMSGLSSGLKVPGRVGCYSGQVLALSSGISQGVIEECHDVQSECERLARCVGSRGPANVQVRFVDGEVRPFEVNPRFSGTTVFRALAGFNEVDVLLRHHLRNQPAERVAYRGGAAVRGLVERLVPQDAAHPETVVDVG